MRRQPAQHDVPVPPGRFPVKLWSASKDKDVFLASVARGHAAIYTST